MILFFDLGGTKTRLFVLNKNLSLSETSQTVIFKTSSNFDKWFSNFTEISQKLSGGKKINLIIGGVGALLDNQKKKIVGTLKKKFSSWTKVPLSKKLEKKFLCPVFLENDATLAALGEAIFGAGKDSNFIVYLTFSTGINGARVVNKKIDPSFWGFEIGNQIIDPRASNFFKKTPFPAKIESLIGGESLFKKFKKFPQEIKKKKFWEDFHQLAALAIYNAIVFWSPETIVLGGSLCQKISLLTIKKNLKEINQVYPTLPKIKKSALGEKNVLFGGLALAQEKNLLL